MEGVAASNTESLFRIPSLPKLSNKLRGLRVRLIWDAPTFVPAEPYPLYNLAIPSSDDEFGVDYSHFCALLRFKIVVNLQPEGLHADHFYVIWGYNEFFSMRILL